MVCGVGVDWKPIVMDGWGGGDGARRTTTAHPRATCNTTCNYKQLHTTIHATTNNYTHKSTHNHNTQLHTQLHHNRTSSTSALTRRSMNGESTAWRRPSCAAERREGPDDAPPPATDAAA